MIRKVSIGILVLIIVVCLFLTGFTDYKRHAPLEAYQVYMEGQRIGTIADAEELETLIDQRQQQLKIDYNVDNIYLPDGLVIEKDLTYHNSFDTIEEVYEKIENSKQSFTLKGYKVTIKGEETSTVINVIDPSIVEDAIDATIRVFVATDSYEAYLNNSQEPLEGNDGSILENVYVDETISYQEAYLQTNETIYQTKEEVARFFLYGSTEEVDTYVVKQGDSMASIAESHDINVKEFLIANPNILSENQLLSIGEVVNIGVINPQIQVVSEEHIVATVDTDYRTNIVYDNNILVGYSFVRNEGEKGLARVVRKVKNVNGRIETAVAISTTEIKPPVDATVVRGGRQASNIGDPSNWFWPTRMNYCLTSYYEWRSWVYEGKPIRDFHDAIDISCTGYGSPIYASANGIVDRIGTSGSGGNQIIINHNNGYYTYYAHLAAIYVNPGQIVSRGQIIGTMGHTGVATGTHLHFAIWVGNPYRGGYHTNPLSYNYN